jgi:hypothetical protein
MQDSGHASRLRHRFTNETSCCYHASTLTIKEVGGGPVRHWRAGTSHIQLLVTILQWPTRMSSRCPGTEPSCLYNSPVLRRLPVKVKPAYRRLTLKYGIFSLYIALTSDDGMRVGCLLFAFVRVSEFKLPPELLQALLWTYGHQNRQMAALTYITPLMLP